jgi:hypothetical protein
MKKQKIRMIFLSLFLWGLYGQAQGIESKQAMFSGLVSRLSSVGELVRVRLELKNAKFLKKGDRVEFWTDQNNQSRCLAMIVGRTNDYLLMRVPNFEQCLRKVGVSVGVTLNFFSQDLKNNLVIAQELVEILNKKHLAITAKKERHKKYLDTHMERVETVNKRYDVLKQKLELEWQKELTILEEDKTKAFKEFKKAEADLNDMEAKLEAYRIHDDNFELNRWSLDPELYIKK